MKLTFFTCSGWVTVACVHHTLSTKYALAVFYADLC